MKKSLLLALTAVSICDSSYSVPLDLGPPNDRIFGDYNISWDSGITSLAGQTVSTDLTFSSGGFVRLFAQTSKTFLVVPYLLLHGTGSIDNAVSAGFTLDANGDPNSALWAYDGDGSTVVSDETFAYGLSFIYPMLIDETGRSRTDVDTLDFFGVHLDFTLPNSDFDIIGGGFYLTPTGGNKWSNKWMIGPHVPDASSTLTLLTLALAVIFILLNITRRKRFLGIYLR